MVCRVLVVSPARIAITGACGTHHPGSDVDLGLYYDRERLDVAALSRVAGQYSCAARPR